jgi:hypothetical protein
MLCSLAGGMHAEGAARFAWANDVVLSVGNLQHFSRRTPGVHHLIAALSSSDTCMSCAGAMCDLSCCKEEEAVCRTGVRRWLFIRCGGEECTYRVQVLQHSQDDDRTHPMSPSLDPQAVCRKLLQTVGRPMLVHSRWIPRTVTL